MILCYSSCSLDQRSKRQTLITCEAGIKGRKKSICAPLNVNDGTARGKGGEVEREELGKGWGGGKDDGREGAVDKEELTERWMAGTRGMDRTTEGDTREPKERRGGRVDKKTRSNGGEGCLHKKGAMAKTAMGGKWWKHMNEPTRKREKYEYERRKKYGGKPSPQMSIMKSVLSNEEEEEEEEVKRGDMK